MASISIPSTPAPKLKALTPTTDPNVAYQELAPQYANELSAIAQEEKQLGQTRSTTLTQLGQDKTTNLTALDQAKVNAFKNYGYSANARGVLFSGFQPYAQNQYTTTVYKPGVDKVNTAYTRGVGAANTNFNTSMISLKDKLAQLNLQRIGEAQQLVLNTQAQNKAQAAAASSAADKAQSMNLQDFTNNVEAGLIKVMGSDKHVSPGNFKQALNLWTSKGLPASAFYDTFKSYINTSHIQDYVR